MDVKSGVDKAGSDGARPSDAAAASSHAQSGFRTPSHPSNLGLERQSAIG
jgi:hypothetical protein